MNTHEPLPTQRIRTFPSNVYLLYVSPVFFPSAIMENQYPKFYVYYSFAVFFLKFSFITKNAKTTCCLICVLLSFIKMLSSNVQFPGIHFKDSSTLFYAMIVLSFSTLFSILLCEYTAIYSSVDTYLGRDCFQAFENYYSKHCCSKQYTGLMVTYASVSTQEQGCCIVEYANIQPCKIINAKQFFLSHSV